MVIVVVTFNRPEYLEMCVRSLIATTPETSKVLVVNNQSTDHTGEVLRKLVDEFHGRIIVHNAEVNLGCALGRNRGWELINSMSDQGPYFAMSDDDYFYNEGWYEASLWALDRFPTFGLVTCHNDQNNKGWIREGRIEFRDVITTASCMMRKECFRSVGGYTKKRKVLGWISADFCKRILAAGTYKIVRYVPTKPGIRLVENMDYGPNSKNLKSLYEETGYAYLRKAAKGGQLEVGDEGKQAELLKEGKEITSGQDSNAVD